MFAGKVHPCVRRDHGVRPGYDLARHILMTAAANQRCFSLGMGAEKFDSTGHGGPNLVQIVEDHLARAVVLDLLSYQRHGPVGLE